MKLKLKFIVKLSKYKSYNNIAEITKIKLSSIATKATSKTVRFTRIGLPYSVPAAFPTAKECKTKSNTFNTKIEKSLWSIHSNMF